MEGLDMKEIYRHGMKFLDEDNLPVRLVEEPRLRLVIKQKPSEKEIPACTFCGATKDTVSQFVKGVSGVHICDECVELSWKIITDKRKEARYA